MEHKPHKNLQKESLTIHMPKYAHLSIERLETQKSGDNMCSTNYS